MYPLFQHPQKTMINNDVITVLFPEIQKKIILFFQTWEQTKNTVMKIKKISSIPCQ